MIHHLPHHDRTDLGPGIRPSERVGDLRHEMLFVRARHVAPERHPRGRRAKSEAVTVAGQVRIRVTGKQEHLLALRAQAKAVVRAGRGIEISLRKHEIVPGVDDCAVGNAKFFRRFTIIGQKPAANVRRRSARIIQFDFIARRTTRVGQRFVDEDGRDGVRRIIRSWRTAGQRAGARS